MYKLSHSLMASWLYAMDEDADEDAYKRFLAALSGKRQPQTPAMRAGIDFENQINRYVFGDPPDIEMSPAMLKAVTQFGNRLKGGQPQVRQELLTEIAGEKLLLVGVADYLKAGILYDIKRVTRYEYGKYASSTQHPMYFELFPEAVRFNYLIFDGYYCYEEVYRRGDCKPIQETITGFLNYLRDAGLMDTYKAQWEVRN